MKIFLCIAEWQRKLNLLTKNRFPISKEKFGVIASKEGLDYDITLMILEFLNSYLPVNSDFPYSLTDDLIKDYEVDPEDLGDFYGETLKKMSIPVPSRSEQNLFFKDKKIYTFRLAIEFIQWCSERGSSSKDKIKQ